MWSPRTEQAPSRCFVSAGVISPPNARAIVLPKEFLAPTGLPLYQSVVECKKLLARNFSTNRNSGPLLLLAQKVTSYIDHLPWCKPTEDSCRTSALRVCSFRYLKLRALVTINLLFSRKMDV